ncbi:DUF2235 domain-containing protein [Enterobacteriaceae bacterium H20N1]|uniref:DUF2235 domain-containing protein n=1 Tax=Dryocola boscaweniae TaxID=2925397 RepID=A0A9X2W9Z8_9ENTR|nr:DUF2235 domain-containing protein [Dryocola boscaweniae]MCT4702972.1 DUF2235 domain-containing protein [Dryocola boscaweniae]MCT4720140.1 DUF2235 domain-containing protein [Dryocola boscaweniae]
MSKNIIFCADGAWTNPGFDEQTGESAVVSNVYQLFVDMKGLVDKQSLLLANEQEKSWVDGSGDVAQVAKYIYGVGDPHNSFVKLLGDTFGANIITPVVRGYTFISRHWQPGDRIYLVGFSQGAWTARTLANLITDKGLLNRDKLRLDERHKEESWRLAASVWAHYHAHASGVNGNLLGAVLKDFPAFFCDSVDPTCMTTSVPVEAVAVWETVGHLGIPRYFNDKRMNVFRFSNNVLHPRVKYGLQAIAIDEQRVDLAPAVWDNRDRIVQVMFPGIHHDVGGGYNCFEGECGLSNGAYLWMHDALDDLGMNLLRSEMIADPLGRLHCEWFPPTAWQRVSPRWLPAPLTSSMMIHQSAIDRLNGGSLLPYQSADSGEWLTGSYTPQSLSSYFRTPWQVPREWAISR